MYMNYVCSLVLNFRRFLFSLEVEYAGARGGGTPWSGMGGATTAGRATLFLSNGSFHDELFIAHLDDLLGLPPLGGVLSK